MKVRYLWPAAGIAAILFLVANLVYLLSVWLGWWPLLFGYAIPAKLTSDQAAQLMLDLAFGQVFLGALAILLAGFLGWYAIREFAESQARPELSVALEGEITTEQGRQAAAMSEGDFSHHAFTLVIHNTGAVIAPWFIVKLDVPFLPTLYENEDLWMQPHDFDTYRQAGEYCPILLEHGNEDENWRWTWDSQKRKGVITFLSNGKIAAYPGVPLPLCAFWLQGPRVKNFSSYTCEYTIGTERSQPVSGELVVELVKKE